MESRRQQVHRYPAGRATARLGLIAAALLAAAPAAAQFVQYIPPGTLGAEPRDQKERLEEGAAEARWRLGKLRLDPQLFLRDAGYRENVFGTPDGERQESDFRVLVAAGLNGYLPLGAKAMFAAFVTPEYSWWSEQEGLRELNVSAGAGLFGFFNRLTVSLDARQIEQEQVLNLETATPVVSEEERLAVGAELELRRWLFVFVALRASEYRFAGEAATVSPGLRLPELDRDFDSRRGGVRLGSGTGWSLALGAERLENEFPFDPGRRSNEGTYPFVEARFEGNRLSGQLSISELEPDFAAGSALSDYSATTGSGRITLRGSRDDRLSLYASRNLVFSNSATDSLFLEERTGASAAWRRGRRLDWTVFAESGELSFAGGGTSGRVDDLVAYGLRLGFSFTETLALVLVVEETEIESNLPGFDRSWSTLGLRLSLRRDLFPF